MVGWTSESSVLRRESCSRASVAKRGSTSTSSGLTTSDSAGLSASPVVAMRDVPPSCEGRYVMNGSTDKVAVQDIPQDATTP